MQRSGWQRTLIFWAWCLVLISILWGWRHSTRYLNAAGYGEWVLVNAGSRVSIGHIQMGPTGWFTHSESLAKREDSELLRMGWPSLRQYVPPSARSRRVRPVAHPLSNPHAYELDNQLLMSGKPGDWQFFLPHWLIFCAVGLPCVAVTVWWLRPQA